MDYLERRAEAWQGLDWADYNHAAWNLNKILDELGKETVTEEEAEEYYHALQGRIDRDTLYTLLTFERMKSAIDDINYDEPDKSIKFDISMEIKEDGNDSFFLVNGEELLFLDDLEEIFGKNL